MRFPRTIPPGSVCGEMATQMDLLPTLARFAGSGASSSAARALDGKDITELVLAKSGAKSPHESFFYFSGNRLHAVRSGKWKRKVPTTLGEEFAGYLKIENSETEIPRALYNLETDPGGRSWSWAEHPDVAERLQAMIESAREDLGDSRRKLTGKNVRPIGQIAQKQ